MHPANRQLQCQCQWKEKGICDEFDNVLYVMYFLCAREVHRRTLALNAITALIILTLQFRVELIQFEPLGLYNKS